MAASPKKPLKLIEMRKVWHLVTRGELLRMHYDTETSGIKKHFVQITGYGDAVADLAGNFISTTRIRIRRPERMLYSAHSYPVTGTSMEEHDNDPSRVPHRIGMALFLDRIEHLPRAIMDLPYKRRQVSFTTIRKNQKNKNCSERILEIPMLDDNGKKAVRVRYHPDRNKVAYRFDDKPGSPYYENVENDYYIDAQDGSKWKLVDQRISPKGQRNTYADNDWIRSGLLTAGAHNSDTFLLQARSTISSKQRNKSFTNDIYHLMPAASLIGRQGEDGFRIGTRRHPATGEIISSLRLGDVVMANTRYENDRRNIGGGITLASDGSHFDPNKAHDETYDAILSLSVELHLLKMEPEILKVWELQADEAELRRILTGYRDALMPFSPPPVFLMPRATYPHAPVLDPVISLGTDEQHGKLHRATMINMAVDLEALRYNAKPLHALTTEEFVMMIGEQKRRPDPVIRIEPTRKWKGAYNAEQFTGPTPLDTDRINNNWRYLTRHPEIRNTLGDAVALINARDSGRTPAANPMMEEEALYGGFGLLDHLEARIKKDEYDRAHGKVAPSGMVSDVVRTIYRKAQDIYDYHNDLDAMLHRLALKTHPIEASDEPRHLENYINLLERTRAKFKKKNIPYLHIFDRLMPNGSACSLKKLTREQALKFRWDLMKSMLLDDLAERERNPDYNQGLFDYQYTKKGRVLFANLTRNFRIVDSKGREMPVEYLEEHYAQNPSLVQKMLESPGPGKEAEWRIRFYQMSSNPSITATLLQFESMGRLAELDLRSRFKYEVLKDLRLLGPVSEEPSRARWETIPSFRRDIERLAVNAQQGAVELSRVFSEAAMGEADIFLTQDEAQRFVGEAYAYIEKIEEERRTHPLREHFRRFQHADPETGVANDRIAYKIPAEDYILISVPETHLRHPINNIRYAPYSLIIPALSEQQKAKIGKGAPLLLRGKETGRIYYPGPVSVRKAPPENGSFSDYYDEARRAYREADISFPKEEGRQALIVQKLEPVANIRRNIDARIQSVKVPSLFFDGLVNPRLAHFDEKTPFTGLVLPAAYCPQKIETGKPIRFREMDAQMGTKLDGSDGRETGHIYESTLQKASRMTMFEFRARIGKSEFTDKQARRFGFSGAFDMWEKLNESFLKHESPDPGREEIIILEFAPVSRKSWAYFNPPEAPAAALIYNGIPLSPSAYR